MNQRHPNHDWYAARLESMGQHASEIQHKRLDIAIVHLESRCQYLDKNGCLQVDRQAVFQHLDSIDFHREVKLKQFYPGDRVDQYRYTTAKEQSLERQLSQAHSPCKQLQADFDKERKRELGQSFTQRGEPTERLAIEGGGRQRCTYIVQERMTVLESHARDKVDTWSKYRDVRQPEQHTSANTPIANRDPIPQLERSRGSTTVDFETRPTQDARRSASTYSSCETASGREIQHRSGPYARGGSVQYTITKSQHDQLKPEPPQQSRKLTR